MYGESMGGWIMAFLATVLALWTYKLSSKDEENQEKTFESISFLGESYSVLDNENPHFRIFLNALIANVKQGSFGLLYEKKEPQVVLLPIHEFYRLKAIEEHLEDMEIANIIKERVHTRDKKCDLNEEFDAIRAKIYQQPFKGDTDV